MKTINIPTSLADIKLPTLNTEQQARLATTKGHINGITKQGRNRVAKGLKKLAKRIKS